ncbi:NAD(P)H:quinone oxidoreductase [Silicimonas algicola]|uniref:NAD(P)H dehydrogenase (Quinone) n=1 Tax=Silicimonas algicola TaxID=1826607 RepID=A0A316GC01_9RHOB|nr:NAD(P)H:quinone oxidoreductase [Silicimonas algicola]AZQ66083.1 NAD(P)H:quinone oxidoreductase [Silicimonas algicola]PWK58384.1 NAD(P)H dehydrogenase (quinone) [Silicimonas algicola]
MTKIAVVFYSTYGTNHDMAKIAAEAAEAAGAEVRLLRVRETAPKEIVEGQDAWKAQQTKMDDIPEVTPDDMDWADGYFFSAPTRYGVVASQMRAFIDTLGPLWQKGGLADKTFTATTSAQNVHGGQETTLISLYTTVMHWGSIIVAPGYTSEVLFESGGNPYGFSAQAGKLDATGEKAIRHQAERLVAMTKKIRG